MSTQSTGSAETVFLFSYGTLQLPKVQQATFGRLLDGRPDSLPGYALEPVTITDAAVIEASGLDVHTIACPTGDPADLIPGTVFRITRAELEAADAYEVGDYARIEAVLASGITAFVYVNALP